MVLNLIDFLEKQQGRVAFHEHDGWQEHPVAVKYHQKYFAGQSSTAIDKPVSTTALASEFGVSQPKESLPKEKLKQDLDSLIKNPKISITWEQVKQTYKGLNLRSKNLENQLDKLSTQLGINEEFNTMKTSLLNWQAARTKGYISVRAAINEISNVAEEKMDAERQFFTRKLIPSSEFDKVYSDGKQMAVGLLPIIWLTQQDLNKMYPEGYVDVYRGLSSSIAKSILNKTKKMGPNDTLTIPHDGVSSYSLDRSIAEEFGKPTGIILHKRIPINKVWIYFPAMDNGFGFDHEEEVLIDSNVVREFTKDEIEVV